MKKKTGVALACVLLLIAGASAAAPASAATGTGPSAPSMNGNAHSTTKSEHDPKPTYGELDFAHPVSLQDAMSVTRASGVDIHGYHFTTDSIIGDYWPGSGMTAEEFLTRVEKETGTAPEIVSAYVLADELEAARTSQRSTPNLLGADLAQFDAPNADASRMNANRPEQTDGGEIRSLGASDTWQPNSVEGQVVATSSTTLEITGKYSWWGLSPFNSPLVMADHWGMEFQFDFYTTLRPHLGSIYPIGYGYRPQCGATAISYKDWAAASTRPYSWYAYVINGPDEIVAPATLGMYGDFNDLSDPCTVSTIAVGMAQPQVMPSSYGDQFLTIRMYPERGDDVQSVLGAIVQPVSRTWCEQNPSMPLMDCMGVTPGAYPGPGPASSRMVLNNGNGKKAPDLCWNSEQFGTIPATYWSCYW